jgi:hypothetical protein
LAGRLTLESLSGNRRAKRATSRRATRLRPCVFELRWPCITSTRRRHHS